MDDTIQTSRPRHRRRRRKRSCDDSNQIDNANSNSNSNSNTTNSLLDQFNIDTTNTGSTNPQQSTPSFASTSQSELRIESYITKQNSSKKEPFILRFKLTIQVNKLCLEVSENDKRLKPCTSPCLDKYKKEVLLAVLSYYFNYNIAPNVKITKKKIHCLLCGFCGIPLGNTDELIAEFLSCNIKQTIYEFMQEQSVSILINIRDRAKYDEALNINGKFDLDFASVFWKSSDTLTEYIEQMWISLNNSWKTNPSETKMHEHYIRLQETVNEWDIYQCLRQIFDDIESKNKWLRFIYGLNKTCHDYYIKLLGEQLIIAAYEEAKKHQISQKDCDDKLYLVHGMANATVNSLLRRYHGWNFARKKKICLVTITNNMLFKYKDLNEFLRNDKVPKRLKIENRGGLRIIDHRFVNFVSCIIDHVTPELQNVFVKYKGELQKLLDTVCAKSKNNDDFQTLFDMKELQVKTESFVHNNYMDVDAKDTDTDSEDDDDDDLEQMLSIALKRVETDFKRGIVVRCIWSYIKKLRPDQNTLSLRAKLQIYHMSNDKKYSSLQAT